MPPLYDAHQHFHFDPLTPHRATILADLRAMGLRRAVVNATNEEEWPVVAALAREHSWVVPSHGIHPWDCGNRSPAWLSKLRTALQADPAAGVGEIGLDRWIVDGVRPDDPRIAGLRVAPMDEQAEVFAAQLALAAELNRPASIHCVQAFGALLDVLKATPLPARGFLLHGYGGPAEMVKPFADLGACFSFNIELLQPRHHARLDNFRNLPADRLLVETDAPTKPPPAELNRFPLPPGPEGEINHPANLVVAYEQLAILRGQPLTLLATQVEQNFRRLFL
ncbi:TatD family deoxyribonuclease [Oleiharenicola lentus]|uniref:TatD family deoxyribonuclease n=1 Tax=Oleiharenicola lentus TaxID=2508720 RepID=A0A4Q1C3Z8_9BACT|nr:TatD family hydrolase [Oleiharenicola lentus]RXK53092.1 TatD family deoxyribonuclease [Oleiharenicola lentus]